MRIAVLLAGVEASDVGALWAVSKPVLFLLVPWLLLRGRVDRLLPSIRGESLWAPVGRWRWAGPTAAVGVYALLRTIGPLAGSRPDPQDYPDPFLLLIGASITFVTANVVEELFFRVALQTRAEAVLGRWGGIFLSSLVFGLMHLPTHGQIDDIVAGLPLTLAAIVAFQGTFGVAAGYLWSRYRNVWAIIALHSVVNTFPLMSLL